MGSGGKAGGGGGKLWGEGGEVCGEGAETATCGRVYVRHGPNCCDPNRPLCFLIPKGFGEDLMGTSQLATAGSEIQFAALLLAIGRKSDFPRSGRT